MIQTYWRADHTNRLHLVAVMMLAIASVIAVEMWRTVDVPVDPARRLAAAQLTEQGFEAVRQARVAAGIPIDQALDPAGTGLVGRSMSPITTRPGSLRSKRLSAAPDFGAAIVSLLEEAGVKPGDTIAVGFSGSFPAINIATLAAARALSLRPVIISSAAASQYGANHPRFTWPDMERALNARGVFEVRSIAISRGGNDDRAVGIDADGQALLDAAIARSDARPIAPAGYVEGIDRRMALYVEAAGDAPIRAYVNVGGGATSVGKDAGRALFSPGLNRGAPAHADAADSVMIRFARDGVPVIHLVEIAQLARAHGISTNWAQPRPVGHSGAIAGRPTYDRRLAAGAIALILIAMLVVVRQRRQSARGRPG